ncbi:MAG TPA: hypothetical protein VF519_07120 [Mycobacteriales bacterium]|jgi:hypothetical protein
MRKSLLAAVAVAAVATAPASAALDVVTITFNPPVVCVTYPCYQPVPVTVCVNVPRDAPTCTPR